MTLPNTLFQRCCFNKSLLLIITLIRVRVVENVAEGCLLFVFVSTT